MQMTDVTRFKLRFKSSGIKSEKDSAMDAFTYQCVTKPPKLMQTSMSAKLWSIVQYDSKRSIAFKNQTNSVSRDLMRSKTQSLNLLSMRLHPFSKKFKMIDTTKDSKILAKNAANTKYDFEDKCVSASRLIFKRLMRDIEEDINDDNLCWDWKRKVNFNIVIYKERTCKACELDFTYPRLKIVKLLVKAFVEYKFMKDTDINEVVNRMKKEIQKLFNVIEDKQIKLSVEEDDSTLIKVFELYMMESNKDKQNNNQIDTNIYGYDSEKLNRLPRVEGLTAWVVKKIIKFDYQNKFINFNQPYISMKYKNVRPNMGKFDLSLGIDNPRALINTTILKNSSKVNPTTKKNRPSILKRVTIGNIKHQIFAKNDQANKPQADKESAKLSLRKSRTDSIQAKNYMNSLVKSIENSGSNIYIHSNAEKKIEKMYIQNNLENVDRAIDFIEKQNLNEIGFDEFQRFVDGNLKVHKVSKLTAKDQYEKNDEVLPKRISVFNKYIC